MPRKSKKDTENPYEKGEFAGDYRELAEMYIQLFFLEKSWFCGGLIPQCELISDSSIQTVLRTQFSEHCFKFIHEECLPRIPNNKGYDDNSIPWEIHYLLNLLEGLRTVGVPKEYQPGLLLLYFKFCKGMKIPPPPLL